MLTPYERYQHAMASGNFMPDPHQLSVIEHFQRLYKEIMAQQHGITRWWHKPHTKGLYLWGQVGVGKTWLMDIFYDSLPIKAKLRCHFHEFMRDIHDQLQRWQGQRDPLRTIAKQLAHRAKILCFDEFFVDDIGDAMILGKLLEALFKEQLVLVMTSNCVPDALYANGLQRTRFVPAIQLIKKNLEILALPTTQDYRRRALIEGISWQIPMTTDTPEKLAKFFSQTATGDIRYQRDIYLHHRPIQTVAFADNIIWFTFRQLCHTPRSQLDYLSIANRWSTVILDQVPQIRADETNKARYLINLIDILYDKKIRLLLAAEVAIDDLYPEGELLFEFQRTRSRLIEMQSTDYLMLTRNET